MIRRTVPQKTISKESSLSGVGLHTGENVELTFKPAPSNTGIVFIREDIDGDNLIEAHIRHISNTDRGTNLDNGSFRIVPDDQERMVWSDIFLYMAGFLPAEDATEVNYKLINESVESCVSEEHALFCTGTNVTAERVIEFDTQDFIAMYGARIPPHDGDESQINLGVLHISDRNHTEAEMVWFTETYKEWALSNQTSGWTFLSQNDPWPVVTRGLSTVNIDPSLMTERPLANPSLLVAEGGPEEISGCGYPTSEYGELIAPDSPYGNQTLFFSDESMEGLCFLNELYHFMGEEGPTRPPTDASYF